MRKRQQDRLDREAATAAEREARSAGTIPREELDEALAAPPKRWPERTGSRLGPIPSPPEYWFAADGALGEGGSVIFSFDDGTEEERRCVIPLVILRDDQVERIAQRVAEILH